MAKATKKSGSSKSKSAPKAKAAAGGKTAGKAKAKGGGLATPVQPDEALAVVVGNKAQPRTQMIKKIWEYIRAKGLQDQKDKRSINNDAALAALFNGKKRVTMFEIASMLNKHVSAA
jgi:upstream activation factor subunit UAF30